MPWSRFHWRIVAGLGTVWILDGLEVTIVGSVGARLTEPGSGIAIGPGGIGLAASIYIIGACLGALFFGQLTDRFGRKKLMMLTLSVYILATVLTAFSFAPWYFFLCRFFTGAGIGGEYAAINSAIDELIPARNRGQVDITINGSYWVGSALGGVAALWFLDTSVFARDFGWRLSFGVGALLGLTILLVRRSVPESPRWLFIHGRDDEAERIVDAIEAEVRAETGRELPEPGSSITVRQRAAIPFREIAKVAVRYYPKRAILGLALFVGQAFLYNAVTFNLGNILNRFFGVSSGAVPGFIVIFAVGNFLGAFLLGRLFDTLGRIPMIAGTYLLSAALTVVLAIFMLGGGLTEWSFIALVSITFFFASAGASAAYLTVSEIFPMETRALAIAFFYAIGTGLGGIIGPGLFGNLIDHGQSAVAIGFFIGAAVMALGGVAELVFGVRAEGVPLEDIAKPITVADAEQRPTAAPEPAAAGEGAEPPLHPERRQALRCRERAEEERARGAEHRAAMHELTAQAGRGDRDAEQRVRAEQALAEIAELRAKSLDELADSHDQRAIASETSDDLVREAAFARAEAAEERARADGERAEALAAEGSEDERRHAEHAETAMERARAHEERALAAQERLEAAHHRAAAAGLEGQEAAVDQTARAQEEAAERDRLAHERDERVRQRLARRYEREHHGLRCFRPGPGRTLYSPGMLGTASHWAPTAEQDLDREIDTIARALEERGATDRDDLEELVGARYWGPGRFRAALHEAEDEGRATRISRTTYAPTGSGSGAGAGRGGR